MTCDLEVAAEMLEEWRAQAKIGLTQKTRMRYEDMRDHYLKSGKRVPGSIR